MPPRHAPPAARAARHRDRLLPPGTRRVLHLDVDAFLASVEQARHPALRGRPVVVGGLPGERNLVMSCSYEARAFGVRPGLLLDEAARRCPEAVFRRGDSRAANRLREALAQRLRRFAPVVEIASIDDFFVDLTGTTRLHGAACDVAQAIREQVRRELHLPLTIGVGTNRMLARLAGKLAKPGGIGEILPGQERALLRHLPVEHLPGVGRSIGARLERFGVHTVGDLRLASRELLFASFGRAGLVLFDRSRGIDPEPVETTWVEDADGRLRMRVPRSIRRDSTFEPEEGRREIVEAMLSYVVERAAQRLRSHGLSARSLTVRLQQVDTRTPAQRRAHPERHAPAERRRALPAPCDSTDALFRHARRLLRELPRRRALVKRVGVELVDLCASPGWQGELFGDPAERDDPDRVADRHGKSRTDRACAGNRHGKSRTDSACAGNRHGKSRTDRQRALDRALDELRQRHGFGLLLRGASWPVVETHPWTPEGVRLRTPSLNQ